MVEILELNLTSSPAAGLFDKAEHTPQSFLTLRVNVSSFKNTTAARRLTCVHLWTSEGAGHRGAVLLKARVFAWRR